MRDELPTASSRGAEAVEYGSSSDILAALDEVYTAPQTEDEEFLRAAACALVRASAAEDWSPNRVAVAPRDVIQPGRTEG